MALDALRRAEETSDPKAAESLRAMSSDWLHIARTAATQETLMRDLDSK